MASKDKTEALDIPDFLRNQKNLKSEMESITVKPTPPTVYVASRASIPERGRLWRLLREEGARIVSSWIDEDGPGKTKCFIDLWDRIENEIRICDQLVLYVEADDFPLKGALVEVGMALAFGKPVLVVAPGVKLDPFNRKPLGSWAAHPKVFFVDGVVRAVFVRHHVVEELDTIA